MLHAKINQYLSKLNDFLLKLNDFLLKLNDFLPKLKLFSQNSIFRQIHLTYLQLPMLKKNLNMYDVKKFDTW